MVVSAASPLRTISLARSAWGNHQGTRTQDRQLSCVPCFQAGAGMLGFRLRSDTTAALLLALDKRRSSACRDIREVWEID